MQCTGIDRFRAKQQQYAMKEPLMDSIFRVRELTNTIANFTYMCLIVCWKEQLSTHHRRNLLFIEIIDLIYAISPLALSKAPMARSIYKLASSASDDGSEREPCSIDTTCSAHHGDQRARRHIALSPLSATTMLCCWFEFDRGRKLQEETLATLKRVVTRGKFPPNYHRNYHRNRWK